MGRLFPRCRTGRSGALAQIQTPIFAAAPGARGEALYLRYHDQEWGVPKTQDIDFFEKMILEGFQSGLSWLTILRKRDVSAQRLMASTPKRSRATR